MVKLFQKMSHERARCLLCPLYCELEDGEVGACHALINKQGSIYPKSYGVISALAVEPIEKKPFKHFLPGTKTLSIGGWGCNLRCRHCENHSISQVGHSQGTSFKKSSVEEVIKVAKEKNCPSVCMTYNEPTILYDFLMDLGRACHKNDLKFIIKTNAYINRKPWQEVCKVVDAMSIDFKGAGSYFEDITECRWTPDMREKMCDVTDNHVHLELSIPIFSGYKSGGSYFMSLEQSVPLMPDQKDTPCHLLKVNPAHLMIDYPTTSDEDIENAREDLSYIFKDIYV